MVTPQFRVNETEKRTKRAHSTRIKDLARTPNENHHFDKLTIVFEKGRNPICGSPQQYESRKKQISHCFVTSRIHLKTELWKKPIINHRLLDLDLQPAHSLMTRPKKGAAGLQYLDSFGGLDSSWTWVNVSLQGYSRGTSCIIRGV